MSQPLAEPALPPATEQQARSHAAELTGWSPGTGSELAFASPGRLRGHVAGDRDLFDVFEFQRLRGLSASAAGLAAARLTLDGVPSRRRIRSPHRPAPTPSSAMVP